MPLQQGQMLNNRYRIVRLLGQGGFGAVYRAWDTNLNRPCAVKENLDTSPEAQRQFAREATVLANLSHPNLPRVTDHFTLVRQGQYLVMDFVEGEDLASLVQRQGPVSPEQATNWILQVIDALVYLHNRQPPVVHRDIKPSNIRITPEGKAMLVDFGLVKLYDPSLKTTLGARAVTPGYAPPEQYGQGSTDPRTDIYALGATLYNLLTGQEPVESVRRMIGKQMPPSIQLNPSVPMRISQAIERAMALEPKQRFQSATEFKEALMGSTPPTVVVKPTVEEVVRPIAQTPEIAIPAQPRGKPAFLWIGVLAVLVICAGTVIGLGAWIYRQMQVGAEATSTAHYQLTLDARVQGTSTAQALSTQVARQNATATAQSLVVATSEAFVTLLNSAKNWPVIIYDTFDSNLYSWPIDTDSGGEYATVSWSIDGGKYRAVATAKKGFVWWFLPNTSDYSDFYCAADVQQIEGPSVSELGLVFRHGGRDGDYYIFEINPQSEYSVWLHSGSDWIELSPWTRTDALRKSASNRLAVVAVGTRLVFYINDQFLVEVYDSRLTKGRAGFIIGLSNAGDQAIWEFDNFELRVPTP